jgi:hypothetical protein
LCGIASEEVFPVSPHDDNYKCRLLSAVLSNG